MVKTDIMSDAGEVWLTNYCMKILDSKGDWHEIEENIKIKCSCKAGLSESI